MANPGSDLVEVIKNCERMGWGVRRGRSGHHIITTPTGKTETINTKMQDQGRNYTNTQAGLRKIGYFEAWENYQSAERQQRMFATPKVFLGPRDEYPPGLPEQPSGMYTKSVDITPDQALEWLTAPLPVLADGAPVLQRPLDPAWVRTIEGWITRGDWQESPEGFVLAPNGGLLEGMHRAHAIVNTGRTVPARVTFNCPPEVFEILNQGKKRSNANVLATKGMRNTADLSSAGKLLRAVLGFWDGESAFADWRTWHDSRQSASELLDMIEAHPGLVDALGPAVRAVGPARGVRSAGIVAYYLITQKCASGPTDAIVQARMRVRDTFFGGIHSGADLPQGSAPLTARNWMLGQRSARGLDKRDRHFLVLIKAWNRYARGKTMGRVAFAEGEQLQKIMLPLL